MNFLASEKNICLALQISSFLVTCLTTSAARRYQPETQIPLRLCRYGDGQACSVTLRTESSMPFPHEILSNSRSCFTSFNLHLYALETSRSSNTASSACRLAVAVVLAPVTSLEIARFIYRRFILHHGREDELATSGQQSL